MTRSVCLSLKQRDSCVPESMEIARNKRLVFNTEAPEKRLGDILGLSNNVSLVLALTF